MEERILLTDYFRGRLEAIGGRFKSEVVTTSINFREKLFLKSSLEDVSLPEEAVLSLDFIFNLGNSKQRKMDGARSGNIYASSRTGYLLFLGRDSGGAYVFAGISILTRGQIFTFDNPKFSSSKRDLRFAGYVQ